MTPLPQSQKLTLRGKDIFQLPPGASAASAKYQSTFIRMLYREMILTRGNDFILSQKRAQAADRVATYYIPAKTSIRITHQKNVREAVDKPYSSIPLGTKFAKSIMKEFREVVPSTS